MSVQAEGLNNTGESASTMGCAFAIVTLSHRDVIWQVSVRAKSTRL